MRLGEVGLELDGALVLGGRLPIVFFLVELVAVLEGGLGLDQGAARGRNDEDHQGSKSRRARPCSHSPVSQGNSLITKNLGGLRIISTRRKGSQGKPESRSLEASHLTPRAPLPRLLERP